MKTLIQHGLAAGLLAAAGAAAATPVVGAAFGDIAGQSSLNGSEFDRFDTDFIPGTLDLSALVGGSLLPAAMRAVGSSVTVQYVGTAAAHEGSLFLSAGGAQALFATRSGLTAADAFDLPFGGLFIDTIGTKRTISGLAQYDELVFGFDAAGNAADSPRGIVGSSAQQVLATAGSLLVRRVDLGNDVWLLGFETYGSVDYADAVLLVRGVNFADPPPTPGLPTPGSLPLVTAALFAAAWAGRRSRPAP